MRPLFLLLTASTVVLRAYGADTPTALAEVKLHERAEVQGPMVLLGDIAEVIADSEMTSQLKSVSCQPAALPGRAATIDAGFVLIKIRQAGIDSKQVTMTGAARTVVTTRSHTVTGEECVESARACVTERLKGVVIGELLLEPAQIPSPLLLPEGQVEVKVQSAPNLTSVGSYLSPTAVVPVTVSVQGTVYRTVNIYLRLRTFNEVAVAARPIDRWEVLKESDVALERRETTGATDPPLLKIAGVVGKRAVRPLPLGATLTRSALETPPAIMKGSKVTVLAFVGKVRISMIGEAREDGWVGRTIAIRNPDSKKNFTATVVDENTVTVRVLTAATAVAAAQKGEATR